MIDTGRCKMAYDDNEDEYSDFYDYDEEEASTQVGSASNSLAVLTSR